MGAVLSQPKSHIKTRPSSPLDLFLIVTEIRTTCRGRASLHLFGNVFMLVGLALSSTMTDSIGLSDRFSTILLA